MEDKAGDGTVPTEGFFEKAIFYGNKSVDSNQRASLLSAAKNNLILTEKVMNKMWYYPNPKKGLQKTCCICTYTMSNSHHWK